MRRTWLDILIILLLCSVVPLWLTLAYAGHRSTLFTATALPVMFPTTGLHELEPLVDRSGTFRWTTGDASFHPPNPGGPLRLRLSLASGFDHVTPTVLRAPGGDVAFTLLPGLRTYLFLLPAQPSERLSLRLESPAQIIDRRSLGLVFHTLTITGGGVAPAYLLAALLLATVGTYLLLRRAAFGTIAAPIIVLALQIAMAVWQAAGFWLYALLSQLLALEGLAALFALLIGLIWPVVAPAIPDQSTPQPATLRNLVLLCALAIACCIPWLAMPDPVGDLELAARRMGFLYERGGLSQAFVYGSDLMPVWLYILYALAPFVHAFGGTFYDPVTTVTHIMIKLPSMLALLGTVALLYWWGLRRSGPRRALLIAGLYAVIPPVWLNAAWWGQVDVLLALPMLATLVFLDLQRARWSWAMWGLALMLKVHAIILAPLLYVLTLRRHGPRALVEGGAIAFGVIVLLCAPFVFVGEGPGLYQAALGSVGRFPQATNRAYNLWWLVVDGREITDLIQVAGFTYRTIGFGLVGLATLLTSLACLRQPGGATRAAAAATIALAFFVLPTQIHERYSFFALPLLLLCAATDLRALVPFTLIAIAATLNIIGTIPAFFPNIAQTIVRSNLPTLVSWINLLTLIGLLIFMWLKRREC